MEKYLKGYLIANGWKLRKIHDLESLLTDAKEFDADFESFLDLGRKLTIVYNDERYPPTQLESYVEEEFEEILSETSQFIEFIKSKISI